jgi:hypothetical protein
MYGLEIINRIGSETNGTYNLKKPTLYGALRRLVHDKLVTQRTETSPIGGERHYYNLTTKGHEHLAGKKFDWIYSKVLIDALVLDPTAKSPAPVFETAATEKISPPPAVFETAAAQKIDTFIASETQKIELPAVAVAQHGNVVVATETKTITPLEQYTATSAKINIPVQMPTEIFTAPLLKYNTVHQVAFDMQKVSNLPPENTLLTSKNTLSGGSKPTFSTQNSSILTSFVKHSGDKKSGKFVMSNRLNFATALVVAAALAVALGVAFNILKHAYTRQESNFFMIAAVCVGVYFLTNVMKFASKPNYKSVMGSKTGIFVRAVLTACVVVCTVGINSLAGMNEINLADFTVYLAVPCILGAAFLLDGIVRAGLRKLAVFLT